MKVCVLLPMQTGIRRYINLIPQNRNTAMITGRCSCSSVTYECSAAPIIQRNCHCTECQRMTGGAFAATLFVPKDTLKITGQVKQYMRRGESGNEVGRGFCPHCGSQLFSTPESLPGLIGIRAGTLDDPRIYQPGANIFSASAQPWDHLDPNILRFERAAPRPGG